MITIHQALTLNSRTILNCRNSVEFHNCGFNWVLYINLWLKFHRTNKLSKRWWLNLTSPLYSNFTRQIHPKWVTNAASSFGHPYPPSLYIYMHHHYLAGVGVFVTSEHTLSLLPHSTTNFHYLDESSPIKHWIFSRGWLGWLTDWLTRQPKHGRRWLRVEIIIIAVNRAKVSLKIKFLLCNPILLIGVTVGRDPSSFWHPLLIPPARWGWRWRPATRRWIWRRRTYGRCVFTVLVWFFCWCWCRQRREMGTLPIKSGNNRENVDPGIIPALVVSPLAPIYRRPHNQLTRPPSDSLPCPGWDLFSNNNEESTKSGTKWKLTSYPLEHVRSGVGLSVVSRPLSAVL